MALDAEIFERRDSLGPGLAFSVTLHVALAAAVLLAPALWSRGGSDWGSGGNGGLSGGAMSAKLVSGIPLPPKPDANPANVLANESPGLSVSQPAPKAVPDEKAIASPDRNAHLTKQKQPKQQAQAAGKTSPREFAPARPLPKQQQELARHDNTVPYGEGGPVATAQFTNFTAGNTAGGLQFGDGGTGGFGSRFGWYTDVVARKVHEAWQSEVNPSVSSARRVYILFDISRAGSPSNVRIEQSSGVPSLDISATRALQRIDTFGPLPAGYSGSKVSVEFWFDYRR
jgi:protein TonB